MIDMLAQTITKLLAETGKTKTALCSYLDIARSTLDRYLANNSMPEDKIRKTAEFFGVSIAYLFGELSIEQLYSMLNEQQKQIDNIANYLQMKN